MNIKFCDNVQRWKGQKKPHGKGKDLFLRKNIQIIRDNRV